MSDNGQAVRDTQGTDGQKAEPVASHKLSREEREDLLQSLEHIVTVGSSNRRIARRRKEWERREQERIHNEHSASNSDDEEANRAPLPPPMLHAEDVRIYGKRKGYRRSNWPGKSPGTGRDVEWDKEHGDCIHPLAFLEARLSDMPPSKRQRVDGPNLSLDTSNCRVSLDEVPRAMLARCWERAVHAESTSLKCSTSLEDAPPLPTTALEDDATYSPDNAAKKCRDLNIHIGIMEQTCPVCGTAFDSNDDLRKHFFGRTKHAQRGCCWTMIRSTQYKLLDQMLQKEVVESANGLLKTVMLSLGSSDSADTKADSGTPRARNWQDILQILEASCDSVSVDEAKTCQTLETMQYEPRRGNIVLNPDILQNAKLRLIDRYADVPK